MKPIKDELLGYLITLGYEQSLTAENRSVGSQSVAGCLTRLIEFLATQTDQDSKKLLKAINQWEENNGNPEVPDDLSLKRTCAQAIYSYFQRHCE